MRSAAVLMGFLQIRVFVVPPANGRGARETFGFAGMLASPWMGASEKSLICKNPMSLHRSELGFEPSYSKDLSPDPRVLMR
jgi:hypothetical protein